MGRIPVRLQNMLTFDAWVLLIRSAHLGDDIIADDGERYLDADGLQLPDHGKDLLLVSGQLAANLQHQVNVTFRSLHRIKKMFVLHFLIPFCTMNGKNKVTEVATRLWKNSTKLDLCWVHTTLMQIQEHYDCESADRHIFTDFVWYGTTI